MVVNIGLTESRVRSDAISTPRTIPWKDFIITSRKFKTEAQEFLIDLLSEKVLDPTRIDLALFNNDKTTLHKKLEILDKPNNIELKEKDLTYLLPLILKRWKNIHDKIFEEFFQKSARYKDDSFQKQFISICKK